MKLYVDGELINSQLKTYTNTNDSTIVIGKHHAGVALDYFDGKIDDIRIYNRSLTNDEIQILKNEVVSINDNFILELKNYELFQNYPNPFNPTTTIEYVIASDKGAKQSVLLKIYDVLGNEVATLVNEEKSPGKYKIQYDAVDLPSGVYFYQLTTEEFIQTKKMLLIK